MLLNTEITVKITNDGSENKVITQVDIYTNVNEILTSLQLARDAIIRSTSLFLKTKYPNKKPQRKIIDKELSELKFVQLFEFMRDEAKKIYETDKM